MGLFILVLRLALAVVFAAAAGKAMDLAGSRQALANFGVAPKLASVGGPALPAVEALIAAALVVTATARWAAVAAALLLAVFIVAIGRLLRAGRAPDCHCFGQIHSEPVGASTLIRNAVLVVAAAVVAIGGPGRSLASFNGEGLALLFTAMATVALAAGVALIGRENRELRKRPRRPQRRAPSGLPKGSPAPEFRLPDVRGGDVALADETGLDSLLVARQTRVRAQYDVTATPSAVLVDRDGTIATAAAVGAPAIEALVRIALRRHRATPPAMAPANALTQAVSSA